MNRIIFVLILLLGFISCQTNEAKKLPIFGEKEFIANIDSDTVYHTIPFWTFVNQNGDTLSKLDYSGKVYVADFFFTRCPGICKTLTKNMQYVQGELKGLNISFISHTVDPKNDSVEALKAYCDKNEIDNSNWNLVTGEKSIIYDLGINGYLVPNQEDAAAPGGFLHSDRFILVDKESRIRGMYSGGDDIEVNQLINDIKILLIEHE